jgi:hypothetical protein
MILKIIVHSFLGPLQAALPSSAVSSTRKLPFFEFAGYFWRCVRAVMIAPSTIHVRPSVVVAGRGLAVGDAGSGAGDTLDDGREAPGQIIAGLMPNSC